MKTREFFSLMDVLELVKKEGLRRGLSPKTIITYCHCVRIFLRSLRKEPKQITKKDIKEYLYSLKEKQAAGNTLNVHLSALKFLFEEILCRRLVLYMKYSKTPKTLPTILTQIEVQQLFNAINNEKHSLMIRFLYSTGLRVSELTHLKVKELEIEQRHGWVRHGKGNKDRLFIIAEKLQQELTAFIAKNQLTKEDYLFPGRWKQPMHMRSVDAMIKEAAKKANIQKNVHCHTLRHSYATHLIEQGYALADLQQLLGHSSMETTSRYVHCANPIRLKTKSPYDLFCNLK